jgi:hypothetical protein
VIIELHVMSAMPLTGVLQVNGRDPRSFIGWLSLLRGLTELVEAEFTEAGIGELLAP